MNLKTMVDEVDKMTNQANNDIPDQEMLARSGRSQFSNGSADRQNEKMNNTQPLTSKNMLSSMVKAGMDNLREK